MSQSVSLILPVCNQQHGLRNLVLDVAEVLTDLATWFEILIIDYGSAEAALETGAELAREFPQIRFVARSDARDFVRATQHGIRLADGEIIFVHDPGLPFSPTLLRSLWALRDDDELVMAQSPVDRGRAVRGSDTQSPAAGQWWGSLQMLRRSAIRELQRKPLRTPAPVERITRTDLTSESGLNCPQPNLASRLRRLVFG